MSGDSSGYQSSTVCSSPPTTHSESDETTSADGQVDEDLRCPVCQNTFKNPYLVCPNHHNLCHRCYQSLVARANHETPICPECREELTHPKENKHLRDLIEVKREKEHQPERLNCQDSECTAESKHACVPRYCKLSEKGSDCKRLATIWCGHCNKDLCDLHFSKHRLALEDDFNRQLTASDAVESHRALLIDWEQTKKSIMNRIEPLLQRIFDEAVAQHGTSMLDIASLTAEPTSGTSTANDAASLRAALDAGDLQAAQAASESLKAKLPPFDYSMRPIAQPPSREMIFQQLKQRLPRMLNKLELRPPDADYSDATLDECTPTKEYLHLPMLDQKLTKISE